MALIKCSECGMEISDKAKACPGCGCPVKRKEEGTVPTETVLSFLFLFIFIFRAVFVSTYGFFTCFWCILSLVFSVLALKSQEKGNLWAAIPLLVTGMFVMCGIFSLTIR